MNTGANILELKETGYTIVRQAISPAELVPIRERWDALIAEQIAASPDAIHLEIKRCLERDPVFEPLMNWPATFPIVHGILGNDVTLLSGGEGDYRAPHSQAYISWHNDFQFMQDVPYPRQNFLVRCTYFIDDVTDEMGPFTLLPGTHLAEHEPPEEMTGEDGQPVLPPEAVGITGKAGDCLLNNTEIWHTNTPNQSDRPRKLLMICYKHAWLQPWHDGYELTDGFAQRQSDPVRRQLCGLVTWHSRFKAVGETTPLGTGT